MEGSGSRATNYSSQFDSRSLQGISAPSPPSMGGSDKQTWSGGSFSYTPTNAQRPQFGQSATFHTGSMTRGLHYGNHVQTSERVVSSTVLSEHPLQGPIEERVKIVEVPVVEEVVHHVTRKEVIEVEKRVPKYEYEWVEKIVQVPQTQIIDKHVDMPQIQEVIRHVPVKQIVDVPREVIRYVPKIETRVVEREVEVPGATIEVPKPYLVENKVVVPRYIDKEVPTIVAQRLHPIISESETDFVDVELREYNPQLIPVDVYIPRPVTRNLIAAAKYDEHRVVDVPPPQYNALVRNLNTNISEKDADNIYIKMADGSIPIMHGIGSSIVPPQDSNWQKYHNEGQLHVACPPGTSLTSVVHSDGSISRTLIQNSQTGYSSTGITAPDGIAQTQKPAVIVA